MKQPETDDEFDQALAGVDARVIDNGEGIYFAEYKGMFDAHKLARCNTR